MSGLDWLNSALCAQIDQDVFYPDKAEWHQALEAKRICARCDVAAECLDFALDNDETYGIFGGYTARERLKLARHRVCRYCRRRYPYAGTSTAYCSDVCRKKQHRVQERARVARRAGAA